MADPRDSPLEKRDKTQHPAGPGAHGTVEFERQADNDFTDLFVDDEGDDAGDIHLIALPAEGLAGTCDQPIGVADRNTDGL